jgi:hypothetical protein
MNIRNAIAYILVLVLVACSSETTAPTSPPTDVVPIIYLETATLAPPTATETPTQTATSTAPPPTETPTPTPTPTPEPRGYGPTDFPAEINPLTGLPVSDPSLLERRPVSVKINLFPRWNRPPWGLSSADIVFDYYHNDGYARIHAIFFSQDVELVGPIRSGRLFDDSIVRMYGSNFAYGGADAKINSRFLNAPYSSRLVTEKQRSLCPPSPEVPLCRFEPSGHDFLLGGTREITEFISKNGLDNSRPNLDGMTFHPITPSGGYPGIDLFTRFSKDDYVHWEYDPDSGRYLIFQDAQFVNSPQDEEFVPLTDRLTEEQISAANVVVLMAPHEYFQRPPADIVEIFMSGTGPAYAFRDGQMFELEWNRQMVESVLYLTFPDGSHYPFKPGNTWFQIVGSSSSLRELSEGSWRFEFSMP